MDKLHSLVPANVKLNRSKITSVLPDGVHAFIQSLSELPTKKFDTVTIEDIHSFMGKWYIHSHVPTLLEKKAIRATKELKFNDDHTIEMDYIFNDQFHNGDVKHIRQTASIVDHKTNAHWRLKLWGMFSMDCLVVYNDIRKGIAILTVPNKNYLWVFSRHKEIDKKEFQKILQWLESRNYNLTQLRNIPQSN